MYKKILLIVLGLILIPRISSAQENNCVTCHQEMEDEDGPSHIITKDIHFQKGLGCASCHGGNPVSDDMDEVREDRTYRGVPSHLEVPQFCARCHSDASYMHEHNPSLPTDQLDKYKTSAHGKRLFNNRDKKAANCISCHTVHQITGAELPYSSTHPLNLPETCSKCHSDAEYMAEYKISTSQMADYSQSVHAVALYERNDLSAPVCNDCHGNHGAAPPGVSSLAAVCGTCHAIEAELFNASHHKTAFEENDFPMCETCHSNHKIEKPVDEWVGTGESSLCIECHTEGDGTTGIETAEGIYKAIIDLKIAHLEAGEILNEAKLKGMRTTDEEFRINEVRQSLIKTRTLLHSYSLDSVRPKADAGIEKAEQVKTNSASLIDEYYFRRKGLALATLFITIMAVALYIKIKRVDKNLEENK